MKRDMDRFNTNINSRSTRNVLGLDDNNSMNRSSPNSFNSEQLVEQRNDEQGQMLKEKTEVLKRISIDIESQVRESNSLLDDLNGDLSNAQALLSNTMKKLTHLAQTATSRHMMYLILFVVFVFLLLYYIISWGRRPT
ncbi:hypothetical protein SAMD00019534_109550, partial [Acytostelium subglobosum LB1]|uniref:hypothetical protein n=1 Tax=Acytostelium subglobosum LB1 TaxID=1410327 RepID=UPI000644B10B